MKLLMLLVLLLQLECIEGRRRPRSQDYLHFEDCGSSPSRPIRILNLDVYPLPLRSPGRNKLSVAINITRELPETIAMDVAISKYFFDTPFKIPCYNNVGTCHYEDLCAYLANYDRVGCPHPLQRRGLPCSCPFQPGLFSLRNMLIRVPKLDGILAILAKGKYESTIRLYNSQTRDELGCLAVSFEVKQRRRPKRRKHSHRPFVSQNNVWT